jgi:hypothetical protein
MSQESAQHATYSCRFVERVSHLAKPEALFTSLGMTFAQNPEESSDDRIAIADSLAPQCPDRGRGVRPHEHL